MPDESGAGDDVLDEHARYFQGDSVFRVVTVEHSGQERLRIQRRKEFDRDTREVRESWETWQKLGMPCDAPERLKHDCEADPGEI